MRDDFVAVILTHGRPDSIRTWDILRKHGYTGPIILLIDDEDESGDRYRELYGDQVRSFSKSEIGETFDAGDNFDGTKGVVYARNAVWDIVKDAGYRYFIELDDDYTDFRWRLSSQQMWLSTPVKQLDRLFEAMVEFLAATPFLTVATAQGGDHIGGILGRVGIEQTKRKAMNSFVCDVERRFQFYGRVNEDVNAYVQGGRRGEGYLTFMHVRVNQLQTQANPGGLTDIYLERGTYVKSFYSVMYAPSTVKVSMMRTEHARLHHLVKWNTCAAKIISEDYKKPAAELSAAIEV